MGHLKVVKMESPKGTNLVLRKERKRGRLTAAKKDVELDKKDLLLEMKMAQVTEKRKEN